MPVPNPYYDPKGKERLERAFERVGRAGQALSDFELAANPGQESASLKEDVEDEWLAALEERTAARIASFETVQDYTRWCLQEYCSGIHVSDRLLDRLTTIEQADQLVKNMIEEKTELLKAPPPPGLGK